MTPWAQKIQKGLFGGAARGAFLAEWELKSPPPQPPVTHGHRAPVGRFVCGSHSSKGGAGAPLDRPRGPGGLHGGRTPPPRPPQRGGGGEFCRDEVGGDGVKTEIIPQSLHPTPRGGKCDGKKTNRQQPEQTDKKKPVISENVFDLKVYISKISYFQPKKTKVKGQGPFWEKETYMTQKK